MSAASEILSLIEIVSPDDTAMLDEIDARFGVFLEDKEYHGISREGDDVWVHKYDRKSKQRPWSKWSFIQSGRRHWNFARASNIYPPFAPKGWKFTTTPQNDGGFLCEGEKEAESGHIFTWAITLGTKPLAELHAIIQAIDFERKAS